MIPYRNLDGDSGVNAFHCESGAITVRFANGWCYRYTDASAGRDAVERMQRLAHEGRGLGRYISEHPQVSQGYYDKWFCPDPIRPQRTVT